MAEMREPAEKTLQLVLVRHGETEWTEKGLLHGQLDSPLSQAGRRHAELAARRLWGETFDALYTSPLGRAVQTAKILSEPSGLTPVPIAGLSEMDFGWSEGKSLRNLDPAGTGPRFFRPFAQLAMALTAERPGRFASRVRSAVEELQASHPHGRLLIVTHWGVLSMLMALLIDGTPKSWREYGPWTACGITELAYQKGSWQVALLNEHTHLLEKEWIGTR